GFLNETAVQALRAEIDAVAAGATVDNHDRARLEMEPDQGSEGTQVRRIYEPCDRYPLHRDLALTPELLDCVEQLVGPDILFHYSKINMKPARIGSVVEWHQDLAYYPLTNPDSVTVLFYLDPADGETGCLRVIPSMHRRPLLDHTMDGYFAGKVTQAVDESGAIELVAPAGSAIFMHC